VTNSTIKANTIFFHKDKSKTLFQVKNTFLFLLKSFFIFVEIIFLKVELVYKPTVSNLLVIFLSKP
jgi:hypothetical protein